VLGCSVAQTHVDGTVEEEAATVLATMGLTLSDAFRMLVVRIAHDKALPFESIIPNGETIEAMEAARRGDVVSFASVEELMADLHEKS